MVIDSINVESNIYWNNDGIDIVDCRNVRLTNSFFNADDDGICLKSEDRNHYCDQIYIANCKVRSSASAIKFGTASRGGFRNITIKDVDVYDTYRSAIAIESVDGGFLENIDIRNINARNTGNAIFIRVGHRNKDTVSSSVKNIYIGNVNVQVPKGKPDKGYPMEGPVVAGDHHIFPCVIAGLPNHPVANVTLENINVVYEGGYNTKIRTVSLDSLHTISENISGYPEFSMFGELPAWGMYVRHAKNIVFKNVNFSYQRPDLRPAFVFDDVDGLTLNKVIIPQAKTLPAVVLKNVKDFSKSNLQLPADESKAIVQLQ
jgi:polygalacturonase